MILYHGSNVIVQEPQILENGFYKDFGYGFYCTILEKQAKRWALTKRRRHIVNLYEYSPDKSLNIKKFSEMTEEWLQFVVNCRLGLKVSAKYSCGFPDSQVSFIIVVDRYLDYFTTIMEDRLWQVLAKPVFRWQNKFGLSMNAAKAA